MTFTLSIRTAEEIADEALAEAKAAAKADLLRWGEIAGIAISGQVPEGEKLSWSAKETAARAVLEERDRRDDRALIAAEAEIAGERPKALAARIVERADRFRWASAALTGLRRRAGTAIEEARTPSQVIVALDGARADWKVMASGEE